MNADGSPNIVCWDCVKGRHVLCDGKHEPGSGDDPDAGKPCECPICHANRHVSRQPVWDGQHGCYYDPGPIAEPVAP